MQGQLRNEYLSVIIDTECAHCGRPMKVKIDSDLNSTVEEKDCEPIVFVPDVDLFKIEDESIIDAF